MNTLKKIIVFSLLINTHLLNSQNEFSKWYFGEHAGLDFSTSPPTALTNANNLFQAGSGCASISDNVGNLLFYSQGWTIYNSAHVAMANGTGLPIQNSGINVVQQPGNPNLYYVFTTIPGSWLSYSIVDMSLAAGMGSVTTKNAQIHQPSCEKMTLVRHCNGSDVWLVTHDFNSNQFRTFLINSNGLSTNPVISSLGQIPSGTGGANLGLFKISPDGKMLAMTQYTNSTPSSSGASGFYLFDFDPATGVVSNSLQLNQANGAYGIEFSPDGKKLYGCNLPTGLTPLCTLYQWDLCAGSSAAIIGSQYTLACGSSTTFGSGALQRAIDGKIYLTASPSATAATYSISVINNPNAAGAAMNFVLNGQSVGSRVPKIGLPSFINPYDKPVIGPVSSSITCQSVSFSIPSPTFAGGCTLNSFVNSYLWDFGEVGSGAANSSTLANPVHTYSATGTYSVKLITYSNCTSDTLLTSVTISSLSPVISVSGASLFCKGDIRTYTASGASTYSWSTNASGTSISLSPTVTTIYTVTGNINGCQASKTFTVNVEPCLGISGEDKTSKMRVYPNPFTNELSVEVEEAADLVVIDLTGRTVLNIKVQKGMSNVNTANLKAGVYIVQCTSNGSVSRFRVVRAE